MLPRRRMLFSQFMEPLCGTDSELSISFNHAVQLYHKPLCVCVLCVLNVTIN